MKENEDILFPTEEEKNESIRRIVETGMPTPCRLSVVFWRLWERVGVGELFSGVGDCVFLALLGGGLVWAGTLVYAGHDPGRLYLLLFAVSPFLYLLLHLLTVWKEVMSGTYEMLMVCRLSLQQVTVLRMLIFGGISVVMSVAGNLTIWLLFAKQCSLLRMMGISFAALFLFAWLEICIEWRWSVPASYFAAPGLWAGISLLLLFLGERAGEILLSIPTAVFAAIAAAFAVLYFEKMKKIYFYSREGAQSYAVR